MRTLFSKRHFFTSAVSVLLSVFTVAVVAYGASTMDTASVGAGTSTPGMAVAAKGGGLFEGPVGADFFYSTSTDTSWIMGQLGIGTTTPGGQLDVAGAGLFQDFVSAAYFTSTSSVNSWLMGGGLGLGTTTPGMKIGVRGGGLFEGPVGADFFYSTSSDTSWLLGGNFGLGTTTPGAKLGVRGGAVIDDFVYMSSFTATSTTATSTTKYGMTIASTTVVDGQSGRWAIGTTTVSDSDVVGTTGSLDPGLTISGVGSAANATGTLFVTGAGAAGGQIIIKNSGGGLGSRCASISVNTAALDVGASGTGTSDAGSVLIVKVVSCPR